jgi:toxin ParE1/3/4
MKIVWTRRAAQHLRAAYNYWTREKSEDAADLMLDRIFAAAELLETQPEIGRPGRIPTTREFVLHPMPFLLVYRVLGDKIAIIALLHGARKWPSDFD